MPKQTPKERKSRIAAWLSSITERFSDDPAAAKVLLKAFKGSIKPKSTIPPPPPPGPGPH